MMDGSNTGKEEYSKSSEIFEVLDSLSAKISTIFNLRVLNLYKFLKEFLETSLLLHVDCILLNAICSNIVKILFHYYYMYATVFRNSLSRNS